MADDVQNLSIKIKINADTKQLEVVGASLKEFTTGVENTGKKAGQASSGLGALEGSLDSLLQPLGVSLGAFAGVAGAIGLVGATIGAGISKWEQDKALNREMAVVVNGLGLSYDKLKDSIDANLSSLRSNTRFTDEEVKKSFATALKYTGDVSQAYRLLQIAENTAVASNKSLAETMDKFGTAMKGGDRATKVLFDAFGQLGVQGKTVAEMIEHLGTTNENTAKIEESLTKTGTELKESFEDTSKVIGEQLVPALTELGDVGKPLIVRFTGAVGMFITAFLQLGDVVASAGKRMYYTLTFQFKKMDEESKRFSDAMTKRWGIFWDGVKKARETEDKAKEKADKEYDKFKADTLKNSLADEQANSRIKEDLAHKLEKVKTENAKNSYDERMKLLDADVAKYRKAGASEIDITAYYASEKTRITLDEENRKVKAKKELEGIERDDAKKTATGQIDLLKDTYDSDLVNYKNQLDNKEIALTEYNAIRLAREKKLAVNITEVWRQEFESQMSILSGFMGSLTSAFGDASAVGKASAIAQATIDTYAGANKALATYPPPFSFIAMGTAIASGLANVAKISSIPMMAEGGIVDKATMVVAGERGREAIIPLNSAQGKSILGGGSGGGGVNIGTIQIQFPNVSSFQDWLKADPKVIKDVVEKKMLQAFNQLAKEGKMTSVSKVNNI